MLATYPTPRAFTRAEKEDLFATGTYTNVNLCVYNIFLTHTFLNLDGLVNCWVSYSTEKAQSHMLLYESEAAAVNAKEQLALKPVITSNRRDRIWANKPP